MLVKEIIYACLDLAKAASSDDSFITEDHVLFLCKKYRSFLIKKERDKEKNSQEIASEFEYQQICLDLKPTPAIDGSPCTGGYYLKSTQAIPKILEGTEPKVYPIDYFQGENIVYVNRDRMRYVGTNPYLQNIIYTALGPDFHLYMKSNNPQFKYLKKLRMNAIFEDFDAASSLLCNSEGESTSCDVMEAEFPIRDYLVPMLIELVVKEISGTKYAPSDNINNASDDMSKVNVKS